MKHRYSAYSPVPGATSLMVIFCVVCMAIFSVLSLITAQSEKRLSDKSAAAAAAYYAADTQAEIIFAQLRQGEDPGNVRRQGTVYSYSVPISPHQSLDIQVQKAETSWIVLKWQTFVTQEPQIQETLTLWDGNSVQEVFP